MPEFNENIWAPWRMAYIRSLEAESSEVGCFLCHYWQNAKDDATNFVLWRTENVLVVLNRFPYTNGHLLIAPARHEGNLPELDANIQEEMQRAVCDSVRVLTEAFHPQGFNIGYNLGRCAGAGLPDHLHGHIVPRWNADTNYMAVLGGIRVIPDGLEQTHGLLCEVAQKLRVGT